MRDFLDTRSFVLRNKRRTNLALGLTRLHINGADLQSRCHTLLRPHIDKASGVLPPQRDGKDTGAGPRTDRAHRAVASLRHYPRRTAYGAELSALPVRRNSACCDEVRSWHCCPAAA